MGVHNDTCGCPRCFHINYPHRANPHGGGGVHNDTCGCPRCFDINYPGRASAHNGTTANASGSVMMSGISVASTAMVNDAAPVTSNIVRVFTLAKELGLPAPVLLDYCHKAGIPVRKSALAQISLAEKQRLLDWIIGRRSDSTTHKGGDIADCTDRPQPHQQQVLSASAQNAANEALAKLIHTITSSTIPAVDKIAIIAAIRALLGNSSLQHALGDGLTDLLTVLDAPQQTSEAQ